MALLEKQLWKILKEKLISKNLVRRKYSIKNTIGKILAWDEYYNILFTRLTFICDSGIYTSILAVPLVALRAWSHLDCLATDRLINFLVTFSSVKKIMSGLTVCSISSSCFTFLNTIITTEIDPHPNWTIRSGLAFLITRPWTLSFLLNSEAWPDLGQFLEEWVTYTGFTPRPKQTDCLTKNKVGKERARTIKWLYLKFSHQQDFRLTKIIMTGFFLPIMSCLTQNTIKKLGRGSSFHDSAFCRNNGFNVNVNTNYGYAEPVINNKNYLVFDHLYFWNKSNILKRPHFDHNLIRLWFL